MEIERMTVTVDAAGEPVFIGEGPRGGVHRFKPVDGVRFEGNIAEGRIAFSFANWDQVTDLKFLRESKPTELDELDMKYRREREALLEKMRPKDAEVDASL